MSEPISPIVNPPSDGGIPQSQAVAQSSLLQEIIATAASNQPSNTPQTAGTNPPPTSPVGPPGSDIPPPNPPKKIRDPMTTGTILKLIGSLLLVGVIFMGSFLAYVVFNPDQAVFFVNIFGIDPADLQNVLKKLINGSFGTIVFVLSIAWIVSLFRAIWTPREQKRKRLMGWLMASITGIGLFSILAFWAYLFNIINASDYTNPGGDIIIYDNDLYVHKDTLKLARMGTTKNIIGPITLRYDISSNAKIVSKKSGFNISSYEINFDGAKCANDSSIIKGADPLSDSGIICTFDQNRTYNITGTYFGKDRMGEPHTIPINPLDTVEIKGLLNISQSINRAGQKIITFDASKIKNLGNPRWIYESNPDKPIEKSIITETIGTTPIKIGLNVFSENKNCCDRFFVIEDSEVSPSIEGGITFIRDSVNPQSVNMTLSGLSINDNEIISIEWLGNNDTRLCRGTSLSCDYTFSTFGKKSIIATITLASREKYDIKADYMLDEPLLLGTHARVIGQDGNILNGPETYDASRGAYIIEGLSIPQTITLNAEDIVTENAGYEIQDVTWRITHGKVTDEKIGKRISYDILSTERYSIDVIYRFRKNIVTNDSDIRTSQEHIIFNLERKALQANLKISQTSDYVPAKITVDASSSYSQNGEIKKFIFNFGEGRPDAIGDAIQTYEYTSAGEKKITLTIINDKNDQTTITKYVVLKDSPKTVGFSTSMSPGVVSQAIDFVADRTNGQVEEYIWNFGDNTPSSRGYEVSHAYTSEGTYTIRLMVRYTDGTQRENTQILKVVSSLE